MKPDHGIEKDFGWITPGDGGSSGAPAYKPIY